MKSLYQRLTVFGLILLLFFPKFLVAETDPSAHAEEVKAVYQCPMHPFIISDKPGNCPICGMKLVRIDRNAATSMVPGHSDLTITPEQRRLIGVKTTTVEEKPLSVTVHAAGHVAYNPDIYNALAEYREAFGEFKQTRKSSNQIVRDRASDVLRLAELKLRLAGFSKEQMEQIQFASGGNQYFSSGIFIPENLALHEGAIWVNADIYEPDSELVQPGLKSRLIVPALPGKEFEGEIKTVDPVLNAMTRIVRARIEIMNAPELKSGMSVDVYMEVSKGTKLAVPEDSVLNSGEKQLVFVDHGNGNIEPREVKTGFQGDHFYEVISGLSAGEKVISSATFLIDSESRLRSAVQHYTSNNQNEKQGKDESASLHAGHVHP